MELEFFVRSSLLQVMNGIRTAVDEYQVISNRISGGGVISPAWGGHVDQINRVKEVNFDIAVTATDKLEGQVGGGIKVFALDFSGKGSTATENSTVSRISFSVTILPPTISIIPATD
jgi:hypothetical protein